MGEFIESNVLFRESNVLFRESNVLFRESNVLFRESNVLFRLHNSLIMNNVKSINIIEYKEKIRFSFFSFRYSKKEKPSPERKSP